MCFLSANISFLNIDANIMQIICYFKPSRTIRTYVIFFFKKKLNVCAAESIIYSERLLLLVYLYKIIIGLSSRPEPMQT